VPWTSIWRRNGKSFGEKALFATYRTLDEKCKSANPGPVRQRRDAVLAELQKQWQRITEFAEAHPEFSEEWVE
jgi:hypothetical protein